MRGKYAWAWLSVLGMAFTASALAKDKPDPKVPTPEAQVLIDEVKRTYAQLGSLKLNGKLSADIDVGGQTDKKALDFSAEYKAPGQYRHEVKDQLLTGSTGQKVYLYELTQDIYSTFDAPQQKASYRQLPGVLGQVLEVQDPGLLLAVSGNSLGDLIEDARKVRILEPKETSSVNPVLAYTAGDGREIQLTFDPQTHLLTQAKYDLAELMRTRGAEKVNSALVTIDYADVQPNSPVEDARFAWTPPADARELPAAEAGTDGEHLVGKPLPEMSLKGTDGKQVNLSDLKGQVVLLDFWATWCPPCVRSLPEINEIYHAKKDGGVQVYAVNVGEDQPTIQKFLDGKKLDLPVLMDSDESAFGKLKINGIPTTVIVKPDGVVHKVFVGIPAGGRQEIERELDAAAKSH